MKEMKLNAEQANILHEIFSSRVLDEGMKEVYSEILISIGKTRKWITMEHITNDEAKALLNAGYKIYSIDGHEQYNKPVDFTEDREVSIEW